MSLVAYAMISGIALSIIIGVTLAVIEGFDFFLWIAGTVILAIVLFFATTFTYLTIRKNAEKTVEFSHELDIKALKDNSNFSGSFYLMGGRVESNQYYYFMTDTSKGKKMDKVDSDYSYINEGDYEPHVKVYKKVYKNPKVIKLLGTKKAGKNEYLFYVPEGTVTTEFEVDME